MRHLSMSYFVCAIITCSILSFITGCESVDQHTTDPEYDKPTELSSYGDLPSTVGDRHIGAPFAGDFPFQINEPIEDLTYEEPTGKWFMADGEGVFGYTIPHGSMEAGGPFDVGLIHATESSNRMERMIRIQLAPCTEDFSCGEPIIDEEIYVDVVDQELSLHTGTIPEKENERYVVSLEVLHEGEIEDTLVSYIYVPEETIRATLEMDEPTDENMRSFTLTNNGPTFLLIGKDYTIEQFIDDAWMVVPYQTAVPEIGIYLKPDGTHTHTVDPSTFPSGHYRFVKTMHADVYDLEATLAVPFTIE